MTDRPILFSGPMVRALLAGTKTQTRRALNPQPFLEDGSWKVQWGKSLRSWQDGRNPQIIPNWLRIAVGDRLYVREHWRTGGANDHLAPRDLPPEWAHPIEFYADQTDVRNGRFRQGMHMPRWASRLTLTVTDVRVERLQDCSEHDAWAEGCTKGEPDDAGGFFPAEELDPSGIGYRGWDNARDWYADLWDQINGEGSWDANPWVAAYTFTVERGNIDQPGKPA